MKPVLNQDVISISNETEMKQKDTEPDLNIAIPGELEEIKKLLAMYKDYINNLQKNNASLTSLCISQMSKIQELNSKLGVYKRCQTKKSIEIEGLTLGDRGGVFNIAKHVESDEKSGREEFTGIWHQLDSLLGRVPGVTVKFVDSEDQLPESDKTLPKQRMEINIDDIMCLNATNNSSKKELFEKTKEVNDSICVIQKDEEVIIKIS